MRYLTRWKIKYNKNRSTYCTARYIFNDLLNMFFTKILTNRSGIELKKSDRVLFIEPKKQGFGDLLFQTTIFELLGEKCVLDLLCKEEHLPIVFNNPYLNRVFVGKDINYKKYDYVIFLSRSTFYENILARKCIFAKKISLDKDLRLWVDTFSKNWWPKAWQVIIRSKFNISFYNNYPKPKLYYNKKCHKKNILLLVLGVERKDKTIHNQKRVAKYIYTAVKNLGWTLKIIGKNSESIGTKECKDVINLVNKTTYAECLDEIRRAKILIGPEGSLAHIAMATGTTTFIEKSERTRLLEKESIVNTFFFSSSDEKWLQTLLPKILKRLHD